MDIEISDLLGSNLSNDEFNKALESNASYKVEGINHAGYGYILNRHTDLFQKYFYLPMLIIPNNNNIFYDTFVKEPRRIYNLPLFSFYPEAVGADKYEDKIEFVNSDCMVIKRAKSMQKDSRIIVFERITYEYVKNLDFFEIVQRYRWMYPGEDSEQ